MSGYGTLQGGAAGNLDHSGIMCQICGHPDHDNPCMQPLFGGVCNCPGEKQAHRWGLKPINDRARTGELREVK